MMSAFLRVFIKHLFSYQGLITISISHPKHKAPTFYQSLLALDRYKYHRLNLKGRILHNNAR